MGKTHTGCVATVVSGFGNEVAFGEGGEPCVVHEPAVMHDEEGRWCAA